MVQKHSNELSWDGLHAILLVARHGTVRAAAVEAGVAHTTLAHRIRVAERAMGISAFVKSVRGYALTDEGARIVNHAERMASESEELARFLNEVGDEPNGLVTVSMNASLLSYIAVDAIDVIARRYPGITINFVLGDSFADLDRRESDIVLRLQNAPQTTLFGRRLCQARSTVYASHRAAAALKDSEDAIPVIGWADAELVKPVYGSFGFKNVRIVATVSDIQAQLAIALAAPVAVELPCYVGDAHDELVRLTPNRMRDLNALWILTHESLRSSPRIAATIEALTITALSRKSLIEGVSAES